MADQKVVQAVQAKISEKRRAISEVNRALSGVKTKIPNAVLKTVKRFLSLPQVVNSYDNVPFLEVDDAQGGPGNQTLESLVNAGHSITFLYPNDRQIQAWLTSLMEIDKQLDILIAALE